MQVLSTPQIQYCEGTVDLELTLPENSLFSFEYVAYANIEQDFVFVAPPSNCREISGVIFHDENENGLSGILVNTNGFGSVYSGAQGTYSISVPTNENM